MLLCCSEPPFKASLGGSGEKGSPRDYWFGNSDTEYAVRNIEWGFTLFINLSARRVIVRQKVNMTVPFTPSCRQLSISKV